MATGTVKWFNPTKGYGEYELESTREGKQAATNLKVK
jgi:hypothetical protein